MKSDWKEAKDQMHQVRRRKILCKNTKVFAMPFSTMEESHALQNEDTHTHTHRKWRQEEEKARRRVNYYVLLFKYQCCVIMCVKCVRLYGKYKR
jgi:hypothetical protein